MSLKTISVVVPVYNSQGSLEPLLDRLCKVLREHAAQDEIFFDITAVTTQAKKFSVD